MPGPATPSARALSALSALASLGSLTEAAEQLGVTRSALSHRISELEKSIGIELVRKSGRKLVLTEDGLFTLGSEVGLLTIDDANLASGSASASCQRRICASSRVGSRAM